MNFEPERLAGRWVVASELGRGGMGRVVLVRDSCAEGVPLAAKVLERVELRDDFFQEVELLRLLAHPTFPAVRGVFVEAGASGRTFSVVERIEGGPLGPERAPEIAASGALVSVVGDLLRGLDHLHRFDLVHGDLAPGNILWKPGSRPRIIDLGAGGGRGERGGRTSGVLAYQPPERLIGQPLAPAGDLWSLGAVLFGLVHGRHPFPGWPAGDATIARAGLTRHILDPLIERLLAAEPSARHPSAAAALAELEAASGQVQPLAVATRDIDWPYIDAGGVLASTVTRVVSARGREALTLDVIGAGQGRFLSALADRLAAFGLPVLFAPLTNDDPEAWISALLAQLGHSKEGLGRGIETLARAGVVVIVDELAHHPQVREVAGRLRAALRWSVGTLLSAGLGIGDIELPAWNPSDVESLLVAAFPRRLVAGRATTTVCEAANGNVGRVVTIAKELLSRGLLLVDSANVLLNDTKAAFALATELRPDSLAKVTVEPESPLAVAERRLAAATDSEVERAAALEVGRLEARASRFPKALAAFQRARALRADAESLAGLARAAVMSGELDTAELAADEGLALLEPSQEAVRAGLMYTRALIDWYRGAIDRAEPQLHAALAVAKQAGERSEEAAIVTAIGLIAHRRGDLASAALRYREALRLGEAARDEARVLTSLQNLGVVFHERGEWTEALDTYRQALSLAEALDQRGRVAQIAGNLGNLWRYLGELDHAHAALARGLEIARADHNRHLECLLANLLGDVASDREAWGDAESWYTTSVEVAADAGCTNEENEARVNLARLLAERAEYARAEDEARRAHSDAQAAGQDAFAAQATMVLAQCARRGGDEAQSRLCIDDALTGVANAKNPDLKWPVYLEAAIAARERGDIGEAERCARELRQILQGQLDAVPAAHREAFRARRDRRAAWRETAALVKVATTRSASERSLGWTRLLEVNKRLASELNVQRLLEYIMDSAILLTGAERGFLLLDARGGKPTDEGFEVRVARNIDQENIRNRHLKISRGIARRVIEQGEAVITVDAMEDERYREQLSVHDLRLRSIMCLPMAFRGRVLGAIYLDNRFRPSAFSDEDIRFMEAFADMAAIALDNARMVESLETSKKDLDASRREVEALAQQLEVELATRTQELEDSRETIAAERRTLAKESRYDNIVGSSAALRKVFAMIDRLRTTDIPVLIEGESGTGKELVARAIHFAGQRKDKAFVAVNCGAIPSALLESELFGHVRGSFTGATNDKKGLFEVAHQGTLLLDEIGELPLEMQVKLLRVLQSGELQKVGASRQSMIDVRILAATNRNLQEEVAAGRFREDLYYRLSVVPIQIPALRQRVEDIPVLVSHFLEANKKAGLGQVTAISKEALAMLQRYSWPGNVRQLEMVLKNASVFADNSVLSVKDFEAFPDIAGGHQALASASPTLGNLAGMSLANLERAAIVASLRENKGNKKRTAEQLGIDRRTLYNKLAAYGIAIEQDLKVS